jgi:hypothetical protein
MLTCEDCVSLSELTEEEVLAIAEHEHMPEIVAAEYGNYLLSLPGGEMRIKRIIIDDIANARHRCDTRHVALLKLVLKHFIEQHGQAPARPN